MAPLEPWESPAAKVTRVLRVYRVPRDRLDLLEYQVLHLRHRVQRFVTQSVSAYARAHVAPLGQMYQLGYQDLRVSS